jgi:uncharacterized protein involved in exopolysaccharide biosynthesis
MENQEFSKIKKATEYVKIFFRRKWFVVIPAFIGVVLGIVACFLIPPTYESNTLIMVEEEKIINPLIQGLAVSTTAAQRMASIKERLLGWNSLLDLTKKLKLVTENPSQRQLEQVIASLRRDISVWMRGSNLVGIAYQSRYPVEAQRITQALTDILVEESMRSQTRETEVAINFIKEQLDVYKRKIKESEIAQLEEQLRNLLVDSTEEHPLVQELRERIRVAKAELESGNFKVSPPGQPISGPAYEGLKQELDRIIDRGSTLGSGANIAYAASSSESSTNVPVYNLVLLDKPDSALGRDMGVNENIYFMLLQKLETAKITQRLEASKEGTRYTIIEPPRVPSKPIKPNKIQLVLLGLVLGGTSGVGLVFGREFMDQSFLDIEDAKNNLELPILGAISRLTTQEEIDKERYRNKRMLKVGLTSSIVLILIAMLISFLKR